MENIRKFTKNRILFVICTIMLAAVCIAPFGFNPKNAYAACSHTWCDEKIMSQATCNAYGSKMQYCSKCRARRTISIPKKNHIKSSTFTTIQNPTCVSPGKKVKKCTLCYAYLETQTIPATGKHIWKQNKVFQNPTCTSNGCIQMICTAGCGQTRMTYPGMYNHTSSGSHWETLSKATCTSPERQGLKCSRCGEVLSSRTVGNALGHTAGRKVVRVATATTDKQEIVYCGRDNCNGIYSSKTITDKYSGVRKAIKNKNMSSDKADKTYKAIQQINSYYNTYKECYSLSDSSAKNYFDKVLNNAEKQKNMKEILDTIDEYSVFFGLLNSDLVDECIDTCSYLKIGADLQAVINSPDNYARMNAVIDTLSDVCGKVPGADKVYCPSLESLQKQWDKSSEKIQKHFSDLENTDWDLAVKGECTVKVEIDGINRPIYELSGAELAANCSKVEKALENHYNAVYLPDHLDDFSSDNIIMRSYRKNYVKQAFGRLLDEAGFFD